MMGDVHLEVVCSGGCECLISKTSTALSHLKKNDSNVCIFVCKGHGNCQERNR